MKRMQWVGVAVVGLLVGVISGGVLKAQPLGDSKPVPKGEAKVGVNRGGFDAGGANVWTYEGTAGEVLTLLVEAEKPANNTDQETRDKERLLDTELFVFDPNGKVIGTNDDIVDAVLTNSFLRYVELKSDGSYIIQVTNWFREKGDETEGHFTLTVYSHKSLPTDKKPAMKIISKLETSTDVMDSLTTIIEDFDTHSVLLINPTYCTLTDVSFGLISFDLKPYSGVVVRAPKGWYSLHGTGDTCELNTAEIHVPEATTVMVVPIITDGTRPSDVPFPTEADALANS